MNKKEKQSIIILYHKNKELLYLSLKTLQKTIPDNIEIIIVANNRNKEELNLSINHPQVDIIKIDHDLLYSEAANIGVDVAKGEIIVLCDQDLFYEGNWYDNLLEFFLSSRNIGAVSPQLLNPKNNRIIDFGIAYSPQTIVHPTRGLLYGHPWAMHNRKVTSACGAILMTRKITYIKCGGMDKTMPYICCDCDFGIQLLKYGLETWVVYNSLAYHIGSSSSMNTKVSTYNYLRGDSKAMFYAKNYSNIPLDIEDWMNYTFSEFKKTNNILTHYYFFDLSSISDSLWYTKKIQQILNIKYYDIDKINIEQSNPDSLQLYNFMPFAMLNVREPIIYFVDSFVSLQDNVIWWKLRSYKNDIIIDIHGNILLASDIINTQYNV